MAVRRRSGATPTAPAHAVAASTFSRLWAPRRKISPTGQTGWSTPAKRSVTQPSRIHAPSTTGSRRLNQRRRAPTRGASEAAPGSSAFRIAQSSELWFRKIRAFASVYAARLPWRSRWSGVTFSTAATWGRKASVVSSWKLETSATTHPSAGNRSASAASGRPMFPPTKTGRSDSAKSAPVSAVVVVFPFVPVIATNSAVIARYASSISPMTGTPRARHAASTGWSAARRGSPRPARPTEGLVGMTTDDEAHALRPERARVRRQGVLGARIGTDHPGADGLEEPARRDPAAGEPHHGDGSAGEGLPPRPPARRVEELGPGRSTSSSSSELERRQRPRARR